MMKFKSLTFVIFLNVFTLLMGQMGDLSFSTGLPLESKNTKAMENFNIATSVGYFYEFQGLGIFVEPNLSLLISDVAPKFAQANYDMQVYMIGSKLGYRFALNDRLHLDVLGAVSASHINYKVNLGGGQSPDSKEMNTLAYGFGVRPAYKLSESLDISFSCQYLAFNDEFETPETGVAVPGVRTFIPETVSSSFYIFSLGLIMQLN